MAGALAASRQRLAAFAAAPHRHRQHAARALLVYHMLEHRSRPRQTLADWVAMTPVFLQAMRCAAGTDQALEGAQALLDQMVTDGLLRQSGDGDATVVELAEAA